MHMHVHGHHHHGHHAHDKHEARRVASERVTLVGAVVNGVLSLAKIIFGWLGNSAALVADGIHSLSDLASDGLVWYAARHSNKEADEDHPYGHGRIETLATAALGAILIGVGIALAVDAGGRIFNPSELKLPGMMALAVAAVSILSKEVLYHYTMHVARQQNSRLLKANAWHHRSDAVSSIVVFVGILGAMLGVAYLDAIAAVVVAVMIAGIGWELGSAAIRELIDTALEPETVERIREVIVEVDGVHSLHMLRTRRMGHEAMADVHILVDDPHFSVSEGHQISEAVRFKLLKEIDEITDVTVHIDPEDDEEAPICAGLPLRPRIEQELSEAWADIPLAKRIKRLRLHYLNGKVEVDVLTTPKDDAALGELREQGERLREAAASLSYVGRVNIQFT